MRPIAIITAALALAGIAAPHAAESAVDEQLAYVAGVYPERTYFCIARPRTGGTSETRMNFDFEFAGAGPVDARMEVIGQVAGRRVSARMRWRGTAGALPDDPEKAVITLTEVYDYDADPLPGKAQWSDPADDVIILRVDRNVSMSRRPYMLTGTQESEFGTNDLRCLDGARPQDIRP